MCKKTILINLELFGMQIIAFMFSFYFFISVIPTLLYSIFTGFLLVWAFHSTFWNLGNKDRKMNIIHNNHLKDGEAPHKLFHFKGALMALPHFIINIAFVFISKSVYTDLIVTIQSFVLWPFIGIVDALDMGYIGSRIIACLLMYIPCATGYMSGMHNISLVEKIFPKIIYKSEKNTEKK
ncbi:MAG: hypothetical protein II998_03575 [Clostridia bacterium]|nr:hypothetical protein [Clostridia bacterium]